MDFTVNQQSAQILERQGILPIEILETLRGRATAQRKWLGHLAVEEGMLTEDELVRCLSRELKIPLLDLGNVRPDPHALTVIGVEVCRQHQVVPVKLNETELLLAMFNPLDKDVLKALHSLHLKVTPSIATLRSILRAIDDWYADERDATADVVVPDDFASFPAPPAVLNDLPVKPGEEITIPPQLDELLSTMLENDASDLHITVGSRPYMRVYGILRQTPFAKISPEEAQQLAYSILSDEQIAQFELENELDLDFVLPGTSRFRVNIFRQRGGICSIFRAVPTDVPSLDQLRMPPIVRDFTKLTRGLVLVTGPTGSGKSTTLAAMLHEINLTRSTHVVTVEDPIEYVHENILSEINQRQIGRDTATFAKALRHVLRQDPDVILIGEMRDPETITAAISAAETGHLVLSTLHTNSAAQTIDRIIDVFPPQQQWQIRGQLANILEGIVTQALVRNRDGKGRSCAQEILVVTDAVRNLIRENKIHQIPSVIQSSGQLGMITMDHALKRLVLNGRINSDDAAKFSPNPTEFKRQVHL